MFNQYVNPSNLDSHEFALFVACLNIDAFDEWLDMRRFLVGDGQ